MNPPTASMFLPEIQDLESLFAMEALNRQFEKFLVRHYDVIADEPRVVPGADGIQLVHFQRDCDQHLRAIQRKVLQGRYTFSPFLGVDVPKPGTRETRPISIASIRDNVVQRALYEYLYPRVDPLLTDCVYGYRSRRSAHNAVQSIQTHVKIGRTFVVDADLTKFFDTVDHDILLRKLDSLNVDDRVRQLVFRFLRTGRVPPCGDSGQKNLLDRQQKVSVEIRRRGVPQGGVLSGLLSNLYLAEFDKSVLDKHKGYVRYADDFVICCADEAECKRAYSLVLREVDRLGLSVNKDKTDPCVLMENGINFVGFRLCGEQISIRSRNIHKFKNRIRRIIDTQQSYNRPEFALKMLVNRLNFKIQGPNDEQCEKLKEVAGIAYPRRRSWIGFYRIVTDIRQVQVLDRWIRRQISGYMWRTYQFRAKYRELQKAGLCSLVGSLYKARKRVM